MLVFCCFGPTGLRSGCFLSVGPQSASHRPSEKLDAKRYSPFKVIEKVGHGAYRLELPPNWKERLHNVFNEVLLTKFVDPEATVQLKRHHRPPLEITSGVPEYEVQEILDSRNKGSTSRPQWEYKVLWKGYPQAEATWEPLLNITNAKEALKALHEAHPEAPAPSWLRLQTFQRSQFPEVFFQAYAHPHQTFTEPDTRALPTEHFLLRQVIRKRQA